MANMAYYSGLLLLFDQPVGAARLRDQAQGFGVFTDILGAADLDVSSSHVCLITYDGQAFEHAAIARRMQKVSTTKYRIRFSDFVDLDRVGIEELAAAIDPRLHSYFIRSSTGLGGGVPPRTWDSLLSAIKRLRPALADDLDELDRLRLLSMDARRGPGYDIMAHERDAVGLALDIFGLDRDAELSEWRPNSTNTPAPFLQGLPQVYMLEDQMIFHDTMAFGDWSLIRQYRPAIIEFERNNEQLTVMNVNRGPVERVLGVDLLYYHHRFQSYVFVQYKRMLDDNTKDWGYRPTDKSYHSELERMQSFESTCALNPYVSELDCYRLHPRMFYFKLCPAIDFDPRDTGLIKGMYIPLDYWIPLTQSAATRGPGGGVRITRSNVGRYINNSLFIDLVQAGWIGSREHENGALEEIVRLAVQEGRSIVLAASREAP
jgi:hypothetical protein